MTRIRILFVCLGNICRSPTAEAVLRAVASREAPELDIEIDSAGTAGYHVGESPDPRSQAAARRRGYDMSGLRARILTPEDFERFDFILSNPPYIAHEDMDNLPPPDVIAREIVEDLEAALAEFAAIADSLTSTASSERENT